MIKKAAAIALLSAVCALPACSATNVGSEQSPRPTPTEASNWPLGPYLYRATQQWQVNQAENSLISRCMQQSGFTYDPAAPSLQSVEERQAAQDRERFFGTDEAFAQKWGYHFQLARGATGNLTTSAPLSSAETVALYGATATAEDNAPVGGCTGQARSQITETDSSAAPFQLGNDLLIDASASTWASPQLQAKLDEWSKCMKLAGYSNLSQKEPWLGLSSLDDPQPSQAEITQAVADAKCRNTVNLLGTATPIFLAEQQKLVEKNQVALTSEREQMDAALERAAKVVEGSS